MNKKLLVLMIVLFAIGCKPADDGMVEIQLSCEKTKSCAQVILKEFHGKR